jgi:hypothetical protein
MRRHVARSIALAGWLAVAMNCNGEDLSPPTLFSTCTAIQLDMVLGRLTVVPRHGGQVRVGPVGDNQQQVVENLVVNNHCQTALVRYERQEGERSLAVEVVKYRKATIRGQVAAGRNFEFHQPEVGDVRLVIDAEGQHRELTAPSIWHLLLSERKLCAETLVVALDMLRPEWRMAAMSDRIEAELIRYAKTNRPLSRTDVERLMEELNSPRFQQRQAAEHQLRSMGPAVISHLDDLAARVRKGELRLAGEQRDRIRHIRASLTVQVDDTPERVAVWLADDEHTWIALLKSTDPERRQLASLRLAALHPQGIQFDPDGDESHRQAQLAQLRGQLDEH